MQQIDWTQVASGFLDGVEVTSSEWKHMQEVFSRNGNDRERRNLVRKLGQEMIALYTRYRRAEERRAGRVARYAALQGEEKYAQRVIENCVIRGVHPVQFLEHWDANVGKFTSMSFPTLVFLKSPSAVDQVASSVVKRKKPKDNNSFSDMTSLDPKLRKKLEAAGFQTQEYNDRYLLTIQHMAIQLAGGKRFFIAKGRVKDMVQWAAKELYGDAE
jgi:hypothetical protein